MVNVGRCFVIVTTNSHRCTSQQRDQRVTMHARNLRIVVVPLVSVVVVTAPDFCGLFLCNIAQFDLSTLQTVPFVHDSTSTALSFLLLIYSQCY